MAEIITSEFIRREAVYFGRYFDIHSGRSPDTGRRACCRVRSFLFSERRKYTDCLSPRRRRSWGGWGNPRIAYRTRFSLVYYGFSGFKEGANHDTDTNIFLRFLKNFGRNIKATGLYFFNRPCSFGVIPMVCAPDSSGKRNTPAFGKNLSGGL
ncbi:MAG: hypothetical protein LBG43_03385 [Treponema sp.]|jgi:hypothetical protein|nr:hypothetical protein [Treponema sp.]